MEVGGKIIYGGGGGSPPPQPTTTITESGPSVSSINRTTVNEIPDYLTGASQDLIARGQALTSRPYEAYTGARVSEFSPLMNKAFGRMENQQVAGQIGQATGLAGLAGERAMRAGAGLGTYNPYEMGGFDAQRAQQYMNPYMQSVVDIERRKAEEAAAKQSALLSDRATKAGAFGGSGFNLQQRALTRDTAQQLADIQTQGLGRAYDQGLARFGAEEAMREQSRQFGADYGFRGEQLGLEGLRTGLQASGQLGQLGQQQFAQEMDITKGLGTAGDIQRQREQALLDVGYQDYLTAQKYPYEQLAFQQGLVAGVPYSTTQRTSGQEVTQPGKQVSQQVATPSTPDPASQLIGAGLTAYGISEGAAKGGEVKGYAVGGVTSLMNNVGSLSNDQLSQLQQTQQGPLTLATVAEEVLNRQKMEANAAQQQALNTPPPQTTVAEEELAGLSALPAPNLESMDETVMAGGGIVAFQAGGDTTRRSGENFADYRRRMFELELQTQRDRNAAVATAREAERQRLLAQRPDGIIPPSPFFDRAALPVSSTPQTPTTPTAPAAADLGISKLIKPSTSRDAKIRERQGLSAIAPTTEIVDRGGRKGRDLAAAPAAEAAAPSGLSALDAQLAAANKAREDAAKEGVERVKKGQEEDGEYGTEREKRLKAQEEGLKGAEDKNLNMAFIQAGLALMQGTTDRGTIANLAAAAGMGVDAYAKGLDKIEAKREKLDDAVARLEELRRTDRQVSRKELNSAQERVDNAAAASADAVFKWGSDKYNLDREDKFRMQQLAIQRAAANKTSFEERMVMALGKGDMAAGYKALKAMDAKPADLMGEFNDYLKANPMMANAPQEEALAAYMRSKMALSGLGAVPRASSTAAGPVRD
jgi:hypothetical protein